MKGASVNHLVRVLTTWAVLIAVATGGSILRSYGGECLMPEGFEGDRLYPDWAVVGDPQRVLPSTEQAYRDHKSLKLILRGEGLDELEAIHGSSFPVIYASYFDYGSFRVWLYDGDHIGAGNRAGFYMRGRGTDEYVGLVSSPGWANYRIDTPTGELDTGYARSEGWREFGIDAVPAGVTVGIRTDGAAWHWIPYDGPTMTVKEAALRLSGPSAGVAYFDEYLVFNLEVAEPSSAALVFVACLAVVAGVACKRVRGTQETRL